MQLKCGQCGAPFRAGDLHLQRGIATCGACGGVQQLPDRSVPADNSTKTQSRAAKPLGDVPLPARMTVDNDGMQLAIRLSWFQWPLVFLLFCAIAWDSFLMGWYWMLTAGPIGGANGMPGPFKLIFFVFPICHVAVAVGLTYFVAAGFLNTTLVSVVNGMLTVSHGPLPWIGNVSLATDDIEQIYCQDKLHTHRDSDTGSHSTSITREVFAICQGRKVKLVSGLHDSDQARFLEQQLERFLKIEDRPVPGEMQS